MTVKRVTMFLVFFLSLAACFIGIVSFIRAQQSQQLRLVSTTNNVATEDLSFRVSYRDSSLPTNWKTPVDWSAGRIYWRVKVNSKPTNVKLRFRFCMRRESGNDPAFQNKCQWNEFILVDTVKSYYRDIGALQDWVFENNNGFDWDKPITEFYISVWDEEDRLFKLTNCGNTCYSGPLNVRDHYPISIDTEVYIVAPGGTFSPPSTWTGCPWTGCGGGGTNPTATTVPTGCTKKNLGDADCNGTVSVTDYAVWRTEYKGGCSSTTLTAAACGDNKDNIGTIMDADFGGDNKVSLADYQVWRNNIN